MGAREVPGGAGHPVSPAGSSGVGWCARTSTCCSGRRSASLPGWRTSGRPRCTTTCRCSSNTATCGTSARSSRTNGRALRRIAVPDDFGTAGELKAHDDALRFCEPAQGADAHSDVLTIVEVVAATATRRGAVEGATTAPQGGAVDRDDDDPSARATAHTTAHTTASHGRAEIREDLEVSGTDQADLSDFHSGGTRPSVAQSDAEVARARAHVREGEGENDDDELDGFVVDLAKRKRMREQR